MTRRLRSERFIGRADELEILAQGRESAATSQPVAILIGGDAGSGKTRLLTEEIAASRQAGTTVLLGRCLYSGGGALPYMPIVEILRDVASDPILASHVRPTDVALFRLAPSLGQAGDRNEGESNPLRLYEQVLDLIQSIASERDLLVAIEDLHWADDSTLSLLSFLISHLPAVRARIVLTYRTDELHRRHRLRPWLTEIERSSRPERIELRPFSLEETAQLITELVGDEGDAGPEVVDNLHRRSNGNVFFIEELWAAGRSKDHLPSSLKDILLTSVRDLPRLVAHTLRAAATTGAAVDQTVLCQVLDVEPSALDRALQHAVDRGLLRFAPERDELVFRHDLLREALYDDQMPGERTRIHAVAAEVLERLGRGNDEVAFHWLAAGHQTNALAASVLAAREATGVVAMAEAQRHWANVLELWWQVEEPELVAGLSRLDAVLAYAGACMEAGDHLAPVDLLEAELVEAPIEHRIRLLDQLGVSMWAGSHPRLAEIEEEIRNLRRESDDPTVGVIADSFLSRNASVRGNQQSAIDVATTGLQLATEMGDVRGADRFRITIASGLASLGKSIGVDTFDELLESVPPHGYLENTSRVFINAIHANLINARYERALEISRAALDYAGRHGLGITTLTMVRGNWLDVLIHAGRWEEARELGTTTVDTFRRFGWESALCEGWTHLLIESGEVEQVLGILDKARAQLHGVSFYFDTLPGIAASLAEVEIHRGTPNAAKAPLMAVLEILRPRVPLYINWLCAVGMRAAADWRLEIRTRGLVDDEPTEWMIELAELGRKAVRDDRVDMPSTRALHEVYYQQMLAENARADETDSHERWLAVAEAWPEVGHPDQEAYCHLRVAEAAMRTGDVDVARLSLRTGWELAAKLGASTTLGAIEDLARRARIELVEEHDGSGADDIPFGLTPRELDVLTVLATGATNKEVAAELFISVKTVAAHVSNILAKMHAKNRGEASAIARQMSLVAPSTVRDG